MEASEYIDSYFHDHLLKILYNSNRLSQLMLQGFLPVTDVVAALRHLLRFPTKLFV